MSRPKCPSCNSVLDHEPATAVSRERVVCRICSWFKERDTAPVMAGIPDERQDKIEHTREDKAPVGPCATCRRTMRLIKVGGDCSTCYKKNRKAEEQAAAEALEAAPAVPAPAPEEPAAPAPKKRASYNPRGTCHLCKREDVLLTSKNGECHRCYKRIAIGHDPLAVLTGTRLALPPDQTPPAPVGRIEQSGSGEALAISFTGDNASIMSRFAELSTATGGDLEDDLATIIELYLDQKLTFREGA